MRRWRHPTSRARCLRPANVLSLFISGPSVSRTRPPRGLGSKVWPPEASSLETPGSSKNRGGVVGGRFAGGRAVLPDVREGTGGPEGLKTSILPRLVPLSYPVRCKG